MIYVSQAERGMAKARDDWIAVEEYLKAYIGDFYVIEEFKHLLIFLF